MSTEALGRSLRAVAVVFSNREMRRLQLAWAAESLAIWSFAIALGVYAFDASGATAVGVAGTRAAAAGCLRRSVRWVDR